MRLLRKWQQGCRNTGRCQSLCGKEYWKRLLSQSELFLRQTASLRSPVSLLRNLDVPLPVAVPIHRDFFLQRQLRDALHLLTVRNAAVVFTPCALLREAQQVRARDMMMVASLTAAQT